MRVLLPTWWCQGTDGERSALDSVLSAVRRDQRRWVSAAAPGRPANSELDFAPRGARFFAVRSNSPYTVINWQNCEFATHRILPYTCVAEDDPRLKEK